MSMLLDQVKADTGTATLGMYQGKPVLSLFRSEQDRFPFTFGEQKAKLILSNLQAIRAFVQTLEEE